MTCSYRDPWAQVYRGVRDDVKVAIKVIQRFPDGLEECSEVRMMQAVSHPNLLTLHDWKLLKTKKGEFQLWLIMELCDRGSIADAIDEGHFRTAPNPSAPLQEHTIAATFKELASGLKALHAAGILHCDISGGNVLLKSSDSTAHEFTAKIADFGLAHKKGLSSTRQFGGCYPYLAHEVLRSGLVSEASDVYSLGVLFYEMLCGERAWAGLHASQVYYSVVKRRESLRWPEGIPAGLKGIAAKLLEYVPRDRCSLDKALELIEGQLQRLSSTSTSIPFHDGLK